MTGERENSDWKLEDFYNSLLETSTRELAAKLYVATSVKEYPHLFLRTAQVLDGGPTEKFFEELDSNSLAILRAEIWQFFKQTVAPLRSRDEREGWALDKHLVEPGFPAKVKSEILRALAEEDLITLRIRQGGRPPLFVPV